MSDIAIKVENLSKQYRLGQIGTGTLSHDLNRWWAKVRGKEDPYAKIGDINDRTLESDSQYAWALKDINFEVKQGEILGVIGRNGAGKSTLLKILSKVTGPTTGTIKAKGRIASLLEVGTGFHPEMTGRENIYMNGTIMGMTRFEINKKLDEIVEFAGISKYLDTPAKRYSSGMAVRLGFAIAAHLEPEILIVDEVLAVGDAEFQKKAIGKMQDVSKGEGRTVLFVSHNMGSITSLCENSMLLENGSIKMIDKSELSIKEYLNVKLQIEDIELIDRTDRVGNGALRFSKVTILDKDYCVINSALQGDDIYIELKYELKNKDMDFSGAHFSLNMINEYGITIFAHQNLLVNTPFTDKEIKANNKIVFKISNFPFKDGVYSFNCDMVHNGKYIDGLESIASIRIEKGILYNYSQPMKNGIVAIDANWTIKS